MSNLHKDLANDQIHNPKDFSTAANDTKLTKNSSGNLEWVADSGGGGGVTQITAGTGVTISPVGGTGNVTINATATSGVSQIIAGNKITISPTGGTGAVTINSNARNFLNHNFEGSAVDMATGTEWGLGNAQYNSEHKFVVNLGTPPVSAISPKNAVSSASWIATEQMQMNGWAGWIWGANGTNITLSLLVARMTCPFPTEPTPSEVDVCRIASVTLPLTGNNSPICWNINEFASCEALGEYILPNDIVVCSAYSNTGEAASFNFSNNISFSVE